MIRLNISWPALEPERGQYSDAYLSQIDDALRWGREAGVYIVLDMHQDGWWNGPSPENVACRPGTEPMWGYDGAPEWATITEGAPRCQFTGRDISPAGNRAFEHFYFNTNGVRDALAETWGMLAMRYQSNPMVAGFDLLNEPGFGETAPATTALKLGEYYDAAIREIRDAGAKQIVFIEPSILWSGLGVDAGPQPAFTSDHNIAFSPHLYAESITMDRDLGIPPIVSIERQFELAQRVADSYRSALWSGEYGYWGDDVAPGLRATRLPKMRADSAVHTGCGSRPAAIPRMACNPRATDCRCRAAKLASGSSPRPKSSTCSPAPIRGWHRATSIR